MSSNEHERTATSAPGLVVGIGATVVMDAAMVMAGLVAPRIFATDKLDVTLIGRWAARPGRSVPSGQDITQAQPVPGEALVGLATHYATGVALTQMYLAGLRRMGREPGPLKATAFGLATSVFPLLVMFPSMGYGVAGRNSRDARPMTSVMLLGHTAFGAGIGLWTAVYQSHGMNWRGTARR